MGGKIWSEGQRAQHTPNPGSYLFGEAVCQVYVSWRTNRQNSVDAHSYSKNTVLKKTFQDLLLTLLLCYVTKTSNCFANPQVSANLIPLKARTCMVTTASGWSVGFGATLTPLGCSRLNKIWHGFSSKNKIDTLSLLAMLPSYTSHHHHHLLLLVHQMLRLHQQEWLLGHQMVYLEI